MPSDDARKRKACQACTHAKAKCSPSGDRNSEICYRCQRLNKECVFVETARRRGPKPRSRVKQLEQRVESLIDLLAVNGQHNDDQASTGTPASVFTASVETDYPVASATTAYSTPEETSANQSKDYGQIPAYDPIEAEMITEDHASLLLKQFRESFILSFPFVVVPASANVNTMRRHQPFLFLAIMATMTFKTPIIQHALAEEFKSQIASRIIGYSHKSLEILMGLLIYAAWYHFFYRPKNQQLSVVIQLCVAMTQDLSLAKDQKDKARILDPKRSPREAIERSSAEKRAFLGTYFVVAAFTQAFRKGSTMNHTRYMVSCCQTLTENEEQPTDALIAPLIRLSVLMGRINDHFSYDDIDNAMIKGDMVVEMSICNFRVELEGIKETVPSAFQQNQTLNLYICLVDIWINECCLHDSFWRPPSKESPSPFSQARLNTLSNVLQAMKTYLNKTIDTPQDSLHHFAFPMWSGWFYAVIVACKLVFLSCNEHPGQTSLDALPHELNKFLPNHFRSTKSHQTSSNLQRGFWDPVSVAKEAGILDLFQNLVEKMKFTFPPEEDDCTDENLDRDPLFNIACLQRSLVNGFNKKMNEYTSRANAANKNTTTIPSARKPNTHTNPNNYATSSNDINTHNIGPHIDPIADYMQARAAHPTPAPYHGLTAPQSEYPAVPSVNHGTAYFLDQIHKHPVPGLSIMNFNSMNFDGIEFKADGVPAEQTVEMEGMELGREGDGANGYDDWAWDLMMQDFCMPGM